MQLNITGHHIDITPALREHVAEKIARVQRHFDHAMDVHVILTVEKLRHRAEATLNVPGDTLHAQSVEPDMYAAIDTLVDKLDRQVKKFKEKITNHHAREARRTRLSS